MRLAMALSGSGMSAIFAWISASPAARSSSGLSFAAALRSLALACTAACSSSVQTLSVVRAFSYLLLVFVSGMVGFLIVVASGCSGLVLRLAERSPRRLLRNCWNAGAGTAGAPCGADRRGPVMLAGTERRGDVSGEAAA